MISSETRVGLGYDIHQTVLGRRLYLGGVEIPSVLGLKGHSDADVLLHAITDAILGTIAAGDIGTLFPDTLPVNKDRASCEFLLEAMRLLHQARGKLVWLDMNIIAEDPKLGPHRGRICRRISEITGLEIDRISFKAKTAEKLGPVGRQEAIEAHVAATVRINDA